MSRYFLEQLTIQTMWRNKAKECMRHMLLIGLAYFVVFAGSLVALQHIRELLPKLECGGGPRDGIVILMVVIAVMMPATCVHELKDTWHKYRKAAFKEEKKLLEEFKH